MVPPHRPHAAGPRTRPRRPASAALGALLGAALGAVLALATLAGVPGAGIPGAGVPPRSPDVAARIAADPAPDPAPDPALDLAPRLAGPAPVAAWVHRDRPPLAAVGRHGHDRTAGGPQPAFLATGTGAQQVAGPASRDRAGTSPSRVTVTASGPRAPPRLAAA